jgi:pilus assembly protein CpaB
MNTQRLVVLGLAAVAAGGVALLVRGLMGGGTPKVVAAVVPQFATTEVLVASNDLQPGQHLDNAQVRWQKWPRSSLDSNLITDTGGADPLKIVTGTVVRTPIVAGEPITNSKIIRTDAAGVMAASLTPGTRAVSITVSTDTGAGGFILPNDRVDVLATVQISDNPKRYRAFVILDNIRILAMDQTNTEDKGQKVVLAKTATMEVTPEQAELLAQAQATGPISLALRSLADSSASSMAASALGPSASAARGAAPGVIRYGFPRPAETPRGE